MKRLLFFICLISTSEIAFCLTQKEACASFEALFNAKSSKYHRGDLYGYKKLTIAYKDLLENFSKNLFENCIDECGITDQSSVKILRELNLVNDNGVIEKEACEVLKKIYRGQIKINKKIIIRGRLYRFQLVDQTNNL